VIALPLPPRATHPNNKVYTLGGTRQRSRAVARQRYDAKLAALAEMNEPGRPHKPRWINVSCRATFYRHRPQDRISDGTNLQHWLKPTLDGFQDAGVLLDDRGVVWEPPDQLIGEAAGGETKVVITVRPLK
jgi:Holliday junction resolvase RusA-like endonuclease